MFLSSARWCCVPAGCASPPTPIKQREAGVERVGSPGTGSLPDADSVSAHGTTLPGLYSSGFSRLLVASVAYAAAVSLAVKAERSTAA